MPDQGRGSQIYTKTALRFGPVLRFSIGNGAPPKSGTPDQEKTGLRSKNGAPDQEKMGLCSTNGTPFQAILENLKDQLKTPNARIKL